MSRFAVLLAVGPGEKELARLADLFESLSFHEPRPSVVVPEDDAIPERRLDTALTAPRNGQPA